MLWQGMLHSVVRIQWINAGLSAPPVPVTSHASRWETAVKTSSV